jgi:hypothetical protein
MARRALLQLRLGNHCLVDSTLRTPLDVVRQLGAVQAQDYAAAKWGIGLRAPGLHAADIDAALDEGTIIRTHVLRPTWHFVPPADLRWMLALSARRIRAAMGSYHRRLGLDEPMFKKSRRTIRRALTGRCHLTRAEIIDILRRSGIAVDGLRPTFLMLDAEIESLVCSGPRRGKQFTYALLDERVSESRAITTDSASSELARRFFTSHGPATLRDFAWWSGLPARDARAAIETIASSLEHETLDGLTYWLVDDHGQARLRSPVVHLVPNFDEYLVAYQDRGLVTDGLPSRLALARNDLLSYCVVVNGMVAGTWRKTIDRGGVNVTIGGRELSKLVRNGPVGERLRRAIRAAAAVYGTFLQAPVRCALPE